MKVSYLITLYNKEEAIRDCIFSISKQFGDFEKEIIIVDDGSTDQSLKIAKETLNSLKNIESKIISQKNSGPSRAVNMGLKLCIGDFVFLVDGDDYILPDSTITLLSLAIKHKSKFVKGRHSNDFARDKNIYDCKVDIITNSIDAAIKFFPVGASTVIIDRQLLIDIGGCDERVFIQDYSISLRVSPYTDFVSINKLLAVHIYHPDQKPRLSSSKLNENYNTAKARMLFCTESNLTDAQKIIALKVQLKKSSSWLRKKYFIKWIFSKHFYRRVASSLFPNLLLQNFSKYMQESLEVYSNGSESKFHF
jgi:glycosyltransferase involved in cell wall biosynthesis